MKKSPAVITGFGAVSPLGLTCDRMWDGLRSGRSGIGTVTAFDPSNFTCKIAGQVPEFKVTEYIPKSYRKAAKLFSRDIALAVIAANEALVNAGLFTKAMESGKINIDPPRFGINLGAGLISCDLVELAPAVAKSITDGRFDIRKWGAEGLEMVTPLWLLKYLPNMLACHIAIIHDIQGPSNTITCAEVSSLLALNEALSYIERDVCDVVLAGGAEAKVNPIVFIRQTLIKRTPSEYNDNPSAACRPFDADAKGCVFGEAAGIVVLENPANPRNRNAKIYAELAGTGQSCSLNTAYESLEPDGSGLACAIEKALADAQISPADLDLIIPHGTGIPADDLAEAKGIQAALGSTAGDIPVWPTKSMLSNTGAASGALDIIAAVCAIRDGFIPAAKNFAKKPDGCNLNIVTRPLQKNVKYVLCCSYTYGGLTAAVILKKPD